MMRGLPILVAVVVAWLVTTPAGASEPAAAGPAPLASDYGGAGVLQMPSARMMDAGTLGLHYSRVSPYTRVGLTLQPFDWFEGTFRYTDVANRLYGPEALSGDQSYKDKAFDIKLRLLEESAYLPELALGGRDIAGTGLFSGEYLVASKRFGDFDFSLGIGWGYLGNAGHIDNPLGWLDRRFNDRPDTALGDEVGNFNPNSWFRGRSSLFGGVQWKTPVSGLDVLLEFDGNDYRHEPQENHQKQSSPFNVGIAYRLADWVDLRAGWERGNTAMIGFSIHADFAGRAAPAKVMDPPPQPLRRRPAPPAETASTRDWASVVHMLGANAGYRVKRIAQREREIVVEGEQTRYFHPAKGIGRAARALDAAAPADIDWFTIVASPFGLPVTETSVGREAFRQAVSDGASPEAMEDLRRSVEHAAPAPRVETELYKVKTEPLTYGAGIGYKQSLGGPDGFILYQLSANVDVEYRFREDTWIAGVLSGNLHNNFGSFDYTAPSGLPRVRTNLREYWTSSDVTLPFLQFTHTRRFDQDIYGIMYAGLLESMFAGAGGEVLYRPMNQRWALGADLNAVRQRGFEQDFSLRDYKTVSGHVTGYYRGFADVLATLSVGRYLAGDYGFTLALSREFHNGVRFGAWATLTDASKEAFGEGSFDKGIYISIPFDELMTTSTLRRAELVYAPLTRDGGARLEKAYSLFDLTESRNLDFFYNNFRKITD